ncbi:ABC transporter permease [Luteimicrobium subarcticum]|uniref:Peptide/nickel transport system permease protein n=1 Tax=Luteimicrobium subarcticum TaxID=620910 RepID=A0A2M8WRX7_9MICO|nr:ABC transporter permease [Luteimicrobium subarcticum]PJI93679.1 peptide/nickel transport system permease protein [Luteimicrobium subarcticum]
MSGRHGVFVARRVGQAALVVLLTYVFTFLVISVLPGDPVTSMLRDPENGFSDQDVQQIVAYYHLDQPVLVQLATSLGRFLTGDLGVSLRTQVPVTQLLGDALPSTLELTATALGVALLLAVVVAYGTQFLPPRLGQGIVRAVPSAALSVPSFVIGIVLVRTFGFQLGWFSITDPDSLTATLVAGVALGIPVSAQIAEVLVANLDHERTQDYVTLARSRGLTSRELFRRHLLKPSALPVLTVVAIAVGELLGGSLITESVFGRQGVGTLVETSVTGQDLPVLQAVVVLAAIVFVVVNLAADLLYPLLDARLRPSARSAAPVTAPARTLSDAVAGAA